MLVSSPLPQQLQQEQGQREEEDDETHNGALVLDITLTRVKALLHLLQTLPVLGLSGAGKCRGEVWLSL